MGLLFVVRVMNLLWVAALAILVLLEKTGPAGTVIACVTGMVMIVLGALVVVGVGAASEAPPETGEYVWCGSASLDGSVFLSSLREGETS
jgi:hypothetical protein